MPAFWSHADTNHSAARPTGSEPPITNPKYRGPAVATMPSSVPATRACNAVVVAVALVGERRPQCRP